MKSLKLKNEINLILIIINEKKKHIYKNNFNTNDYLDLEFLKPTCQFVLQ